MDTQLLVDTETGTILDLRNCVLVTFLSGTDNLTDEDIVSYAERHGRALTAIVS